MSVRDLAATSATFVREYDEFVATVRGLETGDWQRPVRCGDWNVADLARHVAPLGVHFAEAALRRRPPDEPLPDSPPVGVCHGDRDEILAALDEGGEALRAALGNVDPAQHAALVPGPRAASPLWVFTVGGIFEIGLHRNDLLWAIGHEVDLPSDTARAVFFVVPGLLVAQGRRSAVQPIEPVSFALSHDGGRYLIEHDGDQWDHVLEPSAPVTTIAGSISALGLFAFGRVPLTHGLSVIGDRRAADLFKTYLPGP